jgi:hypothetical protein
MYFLNTTRCFATERIISSDRNQPAHHPADYWKQAWVYERVYEREPMRELTVLS